MAKKNSQFKNGMTGSAITVRLAPAGSQNELLGLLDDGTLKVQLTLMPADEGVNEALVNFIAELLGVPARKIDILAGKNGADKLITILDLTSSQVQEKVMARFSDSQ